MNTKPERGANCENDGAVNMELPVPLIPEVHTFVGAAVIPVWASVRGMLKHAADWGRGEYDIESLEEALVLGKMRLWVFSEGKEVVLAMVTEVISYPRKRVCNIYAIAGKRMSEMWHLFFPFGRTWLEANEITEIQTTCRDEVMEKILPYGFVKAANVLYLNWKEQP